MILRYVFAAGAIALFACSRPDTAAEPVSVVVLDDSTGRLVSPVAVSPDGARIAYTKVVGGRSAVFVSDLDGGNAIRVSHGVWDAHPVWSPDGRWIAYQGEDPSYDIYVVPSDGSAPARIIAQGPERDFPYAWLNDGSGVLFNRTAAGDERPMVVPLDGGPARRIGPVMQGNLHATWSPDGAYLGFDLHQFGKNTVWVVDSAAGSQPRQLTDEGLENAPSASMWSPDSRQIVYTSRRTGTLDIWILDVASGQARQLTNDVRDDLSPFWSPDGRWIAFISDRGGQVDLWVIAAAGGNAARLTNDVAVESNPRWTADGKSLLYTTTSTQVELQLVPIAGGPARTLRSWKEYGIGSARLSPDGQTVIFDTDRVENGELFTMPVSGGEPVPFAPSPRRDVSPRYSFDGKQVAFLSDRGGSVDIWVTSAAGGEPRNLLSAPGDESEVHWSPDGTQIAFASNRDVGGGDLWVIPVSGGEARRLTNQNLRPTWVQWSPDGRYLYFVGQRPGGTGLSDYFRVPAAGGRTESLGARPTIGTAQLSHDGRQVAYAYFERGWAFLNLMPVSGGPSTPVTTDTTSVYHSGAAWSFGDSLLIVVALDLVSNRDVADLWTYRLSDGRWNQITSSVYGFEEIQGLTRDARDVLVLVRSDRSQIRRVSVETITTPR